MTLKYSTDTVEGLAPEIQSLYKEQEGGGFVLQVEGAVSKSQFDEINQKSVDASTEAQRRRRTNERVLEKLGLEDASGLDEALDSLIANKSKGGKSDEAHESILKQVKEKHGTELEALKSQLHEVRAGGVMSELKSALMGEGFGETVADMIAKTNMASITFDESGKMLIMQDNGNPLAGSGDNSLATIGDLSSQLAAAMPDLRTDTGKGGGGKPPASGESAGSVGSWSKASTAKQKAEVIKQKLNK